MQAIQLPLDPATKRFMDKVAVQPDGCWEWQAAKYPYGYGAFQVGTLEHSKVVAAHRWLYEHLVGPVPPGLELDHLCHNPPCVNIDHLEPVTHRENIRRGVFPPNQHVGKTHCPQGHPYDAANTYITKQGWRHCRQCCITGNRAWRAHNRPLGAKR